MTTLTTAQHQFQEAQRRIASGWRIKFGKLIGAWWVYHVSGTVSPHWFDNPADALDAYKFQCAKALGS